MVDIFSAINIQVFTFNNDLSMEYFVISGVCHLQCIQIAYLRMREGCMHVIQRF